MYKKTVIYTMSLGKRITMSPTDAAICLVVMFQLLAMLTTAVALNPTGEACDVCECKGPVVICTGRNLTELPKGIPNGTKALELGENFLREIPYDGLLELRSLVRINIANNLIETPFELPESVRNIIAHGNQLQDIKPILRNCVKMIVADFGNNSLQIIKTDTFKNCTKLAWLLLEEDRITEIQPRGFTGLRTLNTFRMTKCDLNVLRPHTFGSTSPLVSYFTIEECNLEEIQPDVFIDPTTENIFYKSMARLYLSQNKVRQISSGAFHGVNEINDLRLSQNEIVSAGLPEDVFRNITINHLDLSSNRLTYIPTGLFKSQTALRFLYLQRNQISVLNDKVFAGLHSLRELMIFDNPITELADWLFYATNLTNLYIFQTELSSIGERPFATVNHTLQHVSIYGSPLRKISDAVWQDLGQYSNVIIENTLEVVPFTNRTDLKIQQVGDGFAQRINVSEEEAKLLSISGFRCGMSKDNSWHCTPCPQGTYGTYWRCAACPPGGFYQIKTGQVADRSQGINCQRCNNGTYITPEAHPGISPANCTVCPTGTNKNLFAGFRACPCLAGFYRTDRFGKCNPCPTEGVNCSEEYQHLLSGFWWTWDWGLSDDNYLSYERFVQNVRTEDLNYDNTSKRFGGVLPKVHKCPRSESCENAVLGGINATCEEGYTGWLCSQCSPYYYPWFDHCFECPKWWWFLLEVIAVCVAIALIVIIIVWQVRKVRRNGRSAVSLLLARGKILLGFYQVMGEIFSALNEVAWPNILTSVGSVFRLLEVNIMRLLISPRCYVPNFTYPSIYIELLVGISFVLFVLLAAWCFYSSKKCYLKAKKTPRAERKTLLSQTKQMCYLFVVMLLFISYPSLSSVILTLLPSGCDLFYVDEKDTLNVTRLRADYSIDCQTQQHVQFTYAAEVFLFYVVGFPLMLFLLLWWNVRKRKKTGAVGGRRESEDQPLLDVASQCRLDAGRVASYRNELPDETDDELLHTEPPSQAEFNWESFLCENYKPRFWYWEILELARKIVQTLFVLLYGPDDHFTMFATIVISVGFLLLHAYVKPMKDAAEHRLQMCSLGTIFLNLLAASLLLLPSEDAQSSQNRKEVLSVVLVLMNLSIIVFVIASLIWTGVKAIWRHGCLHHLGSCIAVAWGWCCGPRHRGLEVNNNASDRSNEQDS
ncbi:uncharacterized protein LOC119734379 [Patiria miniata]|uniref:LRRNT domain-containing protein n=1 Tax=Patiria miniata TaxID=46514 RepID=A0A914AK61_PATMI|nr:uncharacterized protein LOC119734379 [Patiria miniata]